VFDSYRRVRNRAAAVFIVLLAVLTATFLRGNLLSASIANPLAQFLPWLMLFTLAALLTSAWGYVRAKGRSGWWVLLLVFLNIFGILGLILLSDRSTEAA
jgi:hypothetical protein